MGKHIRAKLEPLPLNKLYVRLMSSVANDLANGSEMYPFERQPPS